MHASCQRDVKAGRRDELAVDDDNSVDTVTNIDDDDLDDDDEDAAADDAAAD